MSTTDSTRPWTLIGISLAEISAQLPSPRRARSSSSRASPALRVSSSAAALCIASSGWTSPKSCVPAAASEDWRSRRVKAGLFQMRRPWLSVTASASLACSVTALKRRRCPFHAVSAWVHCCRLARASSSCACNSAGSVGRGGRSGSAAEGSAMARRLSRCESSALARPTGRCATGVSPGASSVP